MPLIIPLSRSCMSSPPGTRGLSNRALAVWCVRIHTKQQQHTGAGSWHRWWWPCRIRHKIGRPSSWWESRWGRAASYGISITTIRWIAIIDVPNGERRRDSRGVYDMKARGNRKLASFVSWIGSWIESSLVIVILSSNCLVSLNTISCSNIMGHGWSRLCGLSNHWTAVDNITNESAWCNK